MKISIITTFYNSVQLGDFVNRSMSCLLNQTYKNIEFVCVNDGSKDNTLKQLKEYAEKDNRIIIVDKENEGVAQYAKAAGQEVATGDFIMLFDHDDYLSNDAIEKAVEVLKKDSTIDAVSMLVKTQYLDGRIKYLSNLDVLINNKDQFAQRHISGQDMFRKTVGRYDVHFRGLIKKERFKSISFRYQEKLVNGDEIVERLIFKQLNNVSSCQGVYEHFIYENSSAKSYNLKKTDIVRTDVILREIFKNENVYSDRKSIFEMTAYKNLTNGMKVYNHFKNSLSKEDKEFYSKRLIEGFNNIDKDIVRSQYNGLSKIYHNLLLSNYIVFSAFYSLKK